MQANYRFLEDYWRFDSPPVAADKVDMIRQQVWKHPGLSLQKLLEQTQSRIPPNQVYQLIAEGEIYVNLMTARLVHPELIPVYAHAEMAEALQLQDKRNPHSPPAVPSGLIAMKINEPVSWNGKRWTIANLSDRQIDLLDEGRNHTALPRAVWEELIREGQVIGLQLNPDAFHQPTTRCLQTASLSDLKTANFRTDCLRRVRAGETVPIPSRTLRSWAKRRREAEAQYGVGNGFLGVLPSASKPASRCSHIPQEKTRTLLEESIAHDYETLAQPTATTAWRKFLRRCDEAGVPGVSLKTYCQHVKKHATYPAKVKREGRRGGYSLKEFVWELAYTTPRHGDRPFEIGHIDHTELDLELRCAGTTHTFRPWLTLLMDAYSRRVLAFYVTFDPPSYRSCLMVLRECVRRHARLPQTLVVDGGAEFHSTYFETVAARYECTALTRPGSEPRFGSVIERMFGVANQQLVHTLQGNTQLTQNVRIVTKVVDPKHRAIWTLRELELSLQDYFFETYETLSHAALQQSPRAAFEEGLLRTGERPQRYIPYDREFLLATLPSTPKGTAKIAPGRGVKFQHLYYWSNEFRHPELEGQSVPVRYDPFDRGTLYAFVRGTWVECHSDHYRVFQGRSEKEIRLATAEWRQLQKDHSQQRSVTARVLADFLTRTDVKEAMLVQRIKDHERSRAVPEQAGSKVPQPAPIHTTPSSEKASPTANSLSLLRRNCTEIYGKL